jgi:hypothetical protein
MPPIDTPKITYESKTESQLDWYQSPAPALLFRRLYTVNIFYLLNQTGFSV